MSKIRFLVPFVSLSVLAACNGGGAADGGADASPDGTAHDGGVDASMHDGGADATMPDGGVDATMPDGGVDATTPDAGPTLGGATMTLVPATYSSVRVATYDATTGAVALATADLDDGASTPMASADAVPVRFAGATGALLRDFAELAVLGADGVTPARRIPVDDAGDVEPYAANPQAIASVDDTKAYVTRLAKNSVLVIDPNLSGDAARTGTIDLSGFVDAGDTDGHVDMSAVTVIGTRAYVALGRYYFDSSFVIHYPSTSLVAVIDTTTDTLVDTDATTAGVQGITLALHGPVALASFGGALYVASNGAYGAADGGIERVDLTTFATTTITTEADLTPASASVGDLSVLVATPTMLVAIAADRAVVVDPTSGAVGTTLASAMAMGVAAVGGEDVVVGLSGRMTVFDVATGADVTPAATPASFAMSLMLGAMTGD